MLKLIGSILIITASAGIGFLKSQEAKQHINDMQEIKRIFVLMKGEMQYTRAPLPTVFREIARKCKDTYREWLMFLVDELESGQGQRFLALWEDSVCTLLANTKLAKEDKNMILNAGVNMGLTDAETQLGAITLFLEQWEEALSQVGENLPNRQRLSRWIGVMAGIFLVILLI